jgi:predicted phage tail protein
MIPIISWVLDIHVLSADVQLLSMIAGGVMLMITSKTETDVAALANNLSQAFRYGMYSNDDIEEVIY